LRFYGLDGVELCFFKSYLTNRSQRVSVNNVLSEVAVVNCGVPQGSVLGPLLFLVLINDLPVSLSCKSVIFADDTTLFSSRCNKEILELSLTMTDALQESIGWFNANGLALNHDKTQKLLFTLGKGVGLDTNIDWFNVGHVKLLGIVLDSKLNWNPHITNVCSRLSRVVCLLRHLRNIVPKIYLKSAYFAFFHSVLVYGISLWGHSHNVVNILKLQKKAIRVITRSCFNAHCRPLFVAEGILTVVNVFVFVSLCVVKENLHVFRLKKEVHNHNTRHNWQIVEPCNRLSLTQNASDSISVKMFNRLPQCVHSMSDNRFKVALRNFLVSQPFYHINEFFEVPLSKFSIYFKLG